MKALKLCSLQQHSNYIPSCSSVAEHLAKAKLSLLWNAFAAFVIIARDLLPRKPT
jgi:hypothetical protein